MSPPAAGRDKQGFPPWLAAIAVLQKPWKDRPGMFTAVGIMLVWSALLLQASTISVFYSNSTPEQRPQSCRASFTCPTKKTENMDKPWMAEKM